MKIVPHFHRCDCGKSWSCENASCTDIEQQWCRLPGCERSPRLRRAGDLEIAKHMLHQIEHYLTTDGQLDLAELARDAKHRLAERIDVIAAELFAGA